MADVTVMGAGIFGLSVAWACAQRGAAVQVVDPYGPAAGASGGLVGALAPHTPERWDDKKQFQFESLIMAADFWAGVEAASGLQTGYRRSGRLQPIVSERGLGLARDRIEQARDLWQGKARWEILETGGLGPWAPASPLGLVVHETLSARLDPRRAIAALLAALESRGVVVRDAAEPRGAVVWATGAAGLAQLSEAFGRELGNGVKGQAALLAHDAGPDAPQIYAGGVHLVPHGDGTVAVGSTSERDFDDGSAVDENLDAVLDKAFSVIEGLRDAPVVARWAGVRPRAITGAPLLGAWPGREGHFVANGGFKIGFGVAPKVGEVMAALVLDGTDLVPAEFSVDAAVAR